MPVVWRRRVVRPVGPEGLAKPFHLFLVEGLVDGVVLGRGTGARSVVPRLSGVCRRPGRGCGGEGEKRVHLGLGYEQCCFCLVCAARGSLDCPK
jgi:hypothetical protein